MSSIRKRNGKYQVQVRKDGKQVSKTFTNKSDAIKWSKEQEVSIEQGSYTSKKNQSHFLSCFPGGSKKFLYSLRAGKSKNTKLQ